ncbi:MAG: glycerol-3-phosphate 1-O-acyltransferase PlsY [bacterium]|nr:glycerol-3-phosphate 1-O-acyltransferase PlsY [bacterium]
MKLLIAFSIVSYFIGSLPFGVWICKAKGVNLMKMGSGNIGATNVGRVIGWVPWGIATFFLDVTKGLLPVVIYRLCHALPDGIILVGGMAILGHFCSVFLKFKGGKAAATSLGVVFGVNPALGFIVFGIWLVALILGGYVSLATIIAALALALLSLLFEPSHWISVPLSIFSLLIILKHHSNIKRLWAGKEPTIWEDLTKKKWAKKPPRPGVLRMGFVVNTTNDPKFFKEKASQKFKFMKYLPARFVFNVLRRAIPVVFYSMGRITIRSRTGQVIEMIFHGVPLTASELKKWPSCKTVPVITKAVGYLEMQGCAVVGLGGYTSIAGEGGKVIGDTFKDRLAITTGNGYTSVSGVEAFMAIVGKAGYDLSRESVAIVGVGSVGKSVAILLAPHVKELLLVKHQADLEPFIRRYQLTNARVVTLSEALKSSKLFVTVTSAIGGLKIESEDFQRGSIIIDLARPRDIAREVDRRQSLLVIDGGIVAAPEVLDQTFNFGFRPGTLFGCMTETFLLGLAGRKNGVYSISDGISPEWLDYLSELADQHGFRVVGRRQFDEPLTDSRFRAFLAAADLPGGVK